MNDAVREDRRDRLASFVAPRVDAMPEARRHSLRVQRLRRWLVWGSGAIAVAVAGGMAFQALRYLPVDLRFSRIATQGTKITIESPKLVGYRKDGRPYELRARRAVQDITKPNVFELEALEVRIERDNDSVVILAAGAGVYDAKQDHADLSGGARMYDGEHFDMRSDSAVADFRAAVVTSDQPTTLTLDRAVVTGNAVEFSQNERRLTFSGSVHSHFSGDPEDEASEPDPAPTERPSP
jgi:lipopolysaccharide export system protein LptC